MQCLTVALYGYMFTVTSLDIIMSGVWWVDSTYWCQK